MGSSASWLPWNSFLFRDDLIRRGGSHSLADACSWQGPCKLIKQHCQHLARRGRTECGTGDEHYVGAWADV